MDKIGFVVNTDKDKAKVIVRRVSACGDKCTSCEGSCNVSGTIVNIKNSANAESGDYVEIQMATSSVLRTAFIVYVVPLILMIGSITIGLNIGSTLGINNIELLGVAFGGVSLLISFFLLRVIDKSIQNKSKSGFEMVKILSDPLR
ncbi:SoxR reducing system RseC family protein [Sporosalibacterium faouarense]|uniref:SoxR reducing system RseC family protein n=1 Tax=Sporosalibacterium faouarense TaxID=516123 RepID=UPI00192BD688